MAAPVNTATNLIGCQQPKKTKVAREMRQALPLRFPGESVTSLFTRHCSTTPNPLRTYLKPSGNKKKEIVRSACSSELIYPFRSSYHVAPALISISYETNFAAAGFAHFMRLVYAWAPARFPRRAAQPRSGAHGTRILSGRFGGGAARFSLLKNGSFQRATGCPT